MERVSMSAEIDQLLPDQTTESGSGAKTKASGNEFEMPKALKRPRDVSYSVRSLYEDIKRGLIDVNPEYQRDIVWKMDKQMMLIDSVFTNHYMPPIILAVIYDDNGTEVRKICLDGKQRLTSLQLFMDGLIPLKHPETLKNWWFTDAESSTTTSRSKLVIPERIRTSFANRQIRCTEYEDLDEEDEREIFRRVQLGVALSSAEKLRVLNTRRAKFINELKERFVTEDGLAASSFRWERSRGADYRCLAQAVYVIFRWSVDNGAALKNAGTLPQVEKWLEDDNEPLPENFIANIKETFTIMVELTRNVEHSKSFEAYPKVSPIEIIGVLVLVYVHSVIASLSEKLSSAELSAAFLKMRHNVRAAHKDIRLNDRVGKTIVAFVKEYRKPAAAPSPVSVPVSVPQLPPSLSRINTTQNAASLVNNAPPLRNDPAPATDAPKRKRDSTSNAESRAAKRFTASLPYDSMRNSTAVWSSSPLTSGSTQATAESQANRVVAPAPNSAPVAPAVAVATYPPGTHPYWNPQMLPSPEPHFSQAPGQYYPGTHYRYTGPVPSTASIHVRYPDPSGHNQASLTVRTHTHPTPSSTSSNSTASASALPSIAVKIEPDASPVSTSAAKLLLEQQQLNNLIGQQVSVTQGPRPPKVIGTAQQDYYRSAPERRDTR